MLRLPHLGSQQEVPVCGQALVIHSWISSCTIYSPLHTLLTNVSQLATSTDTLSPVLAEDRSATPECLNSTRSLLHVCHCLSFATCGSIQKLSTQQSQHVAVSTPILYMSVLPFRIPMPPFVKLFLLQGLT
jgi:hypothetical protein